MPFRPPIHRHPGWKPRAVKAREHDQRRGNSDARGYGSAWRRLRAAFLAAHPVCVGCGVKASHVDHVVPRARGGSDDWSNLQPLCASCHSAKTAKHDGGLGNPRSGGAMR